ncbi:MAG: CHAP domain-containing protein [Asticcacaulis sp.]
MALLTFCAAGSLEAKTRAHKSAKPAAHAAAKAKSNSTYLQCVTFARQFTGMQIFGDAWTWWASATNRFEKGTTPKPGAVMVFKPQGKMNLGHVAVVSQIITDRYIQITHANWSPINGRRGQIEEHVNVLDVSDKGDWSRVKVWYGPLNDLGSTVYTTYGFIYQDPTAVHLGDKVINIATPDITPLAPMAKPAQQVALATPADVSHDLEAALNASNNRVTANLKPYSPRARQVGATVKGKSAVDLVAKIEQDNAAAAKAKNTAHTDAKP